MQIASLEAICRRISPHEGDPCVRDGPLLRAAGPQERAGGIEPPSMAWKAIALPLSYARGCRGGHCTKASGDGDIRVW